MEPNDNCCFCGEQCDGSLMRTDRRYERVRNLLNDPVVPRRPSGGIAVCHLHQRAMAFAGGFLEFQQYVLKAAIHRATIEKRNGKAALVRADEAWRNLFKMEHAS